MAEDIAVLGIEVQTRGLPETVRDLDRLEGAGARAERATDRVVDGFRALTGVLAGLGVAATVRQFVQVADEMANMDARIRLVTKSQQEFAHVQSELFRQSQAAQTSLRANADLYVSMARATDGLGVSQDRLLALTDGISKAFVVSGAGAQEMDGAIRQLGQALQSGVLRGDEFNSMMEGAPRLMRALADGMKVPVGALREMAQNGELVTAKLLPALESGMGGVLSEFDRMPVTVSRATQALQDAMATMVSATNQQIGANETLARSILGIADGVNGMKDVLDAMARSASGAETSTSSFASALGEGLAVTFETVAVLGTNLAYVLEGIGREIGGIAAQAAAAARFDFAAASAIGDMMKDDAAAARAAVDAQTAAILSARANAAELRQVMESARKGSADYATTVGRLIEMQNAGTISAQQFRTAVESLQPAANRSSAPVGKLGQSLGKVGKGAKSAKDEIEAFMLKLDAQEIEKAARAVEEWGQSWEKTLGSLSDQRNALEEQIRYYGMTEAQIAQVTLRRAEEQLQIARGRPGNEAQIALLETEVQLRREIAAAAGTIGAMDANKAAADRAAEDWERASAAIEDALIDSLMEGGKSGAEYIEGLFRTMVLRPIVQAIVSPVAGGITSALGFGGPSSAAGGLGSLNSLSSAWSALSGGMSASVGGVISGAGSLLGSSTLGAFGAGMQGSTLAAGLAGPTTAGASGAMGLGASFGAALPWVAGGLALANALGAFKGPTYHSGAAVEYGTNNTAAMLSHMQRVGDTRVWGGFSETDAKGGAAYRDPLTALARGVTDTIESALSAFGSGGQVSAYAAFGADGKDASRGSLRIFDALGNLLGANSDQLLRGQKYSKDAQKGFTEFSADAGRVVRDALIAADLPAWVDDILGTIGDGVSLDQLSAVIGELSRFAEQATDKTTLWQKATRNLYDEFAALGVEMPQTTAEFNRLIQGSGDLGAELYALAPAFYQLSNVVDEVFASISRTTADSVRDIEMAVLDNAGKYGYLDNEIDRLLEQLNTAYDPTQIQSLFEQINAKTTQAFNLLDEGEQKRLATQFIDRLYEAESLAQSRLSVTPIDYQPQQDAAKAQQAAAEKQAQAADAQIQAANAITSAAGAIASAANRITSSDNSSALAGLTSALSALRPAEVGY